ncbi:MAG TPA: nuclear transport factor 2 family protein [Pelomicrobium sp.]|nr:nuclear transport factor 2 family protein [Pelomicrobium sp.]
MPTLDELVTYFETLTPERVAEMGRYYTEDAYFKDPHNEVRRLADIQAIFHRMFEQVDEPRFRITERIGAGDSVALVWEMHFRFRSFRRGETQVIRGVTHLRLGADGRVCFHRDYWDAAEELYEKIPLLGFLMRRLRHAV